MESRDYEEFIASFNARGVRYLVVGALAVTLHTRSRAIRDLGSLVGPTPANGRRVLAALRDFFAGADLGYLVGSILDPGSSLQLGVAPVRIDLISVIPGLKSLGAAWKNRVDGRFGCDPAHYPGLEGLRSCKRATSRPQHLADVRIPERARGSACPSASRRSSRREGAKSR